MSRYIDADDAVERLGAYLMADAQIEYGGLASEDIEDWKELANDILKGSPRIDIVRCKECRFAEFRQHNQAYMCLYRGFLMYNDGEFYCSYGEREGE